MQRAGLPSTIGDTSGRQASGNQPVTVHVRQTSEVIAPGCGHIVLSGLDSSYTAKSKQRLCLPGNALPATNQGGAELAQCASECPASTTREKSKPGQGQVTAKEDCQL